MKSAISTPRPSLECAISRSSCLAWCGVAAPGDGHVLLLGGHRPGEGSSSARVERLDPVTGVCTALPPLLGRRMAFASDTLADGRVVLAGGYGGGGYLASAEVYDPAAGISTALPPMSRARDDAAGVVLDDGRFAVIGGYDGHTRLASGEALDLRTNAWQALPDLELGRSGHAAFGAGGTVLVAGGYGEGVGSTGTVEVLDGDRWRAVAAAQLPEPASGFGFTVARS